MNFTERLAGILNISFQINTSCFTTSASNRSHTKGSNWIEFSSRTQHKRKRNCPAFSQIPQQCCAPCTTINVRQHFRSNFPLEATPIPCFWSVSASRHKNNRNKSCQSWPRQTLNSSNTVQFCNNSHRGKPMPRRRPDEDQQQRQVRDKPY